MKLHVGPQLFLEGAPADYVNSLKTLTTGENPDWSLWNQKVKIRHTLKYVLPEPPKTIQLFTLRGSDIFVPRGLLPKILEDFPGIEIHSHLSDTPASFTLNVVLRDYQQSVVDIAVRENFGIIEAPAGAGKTIIGYALAARLQKKTLFCVHTGRLLKQTADGFEQLFGEPCGIIGGGKKEIKNFTVGMMQTLIGMDLDSLRNEFGLLIIDEAHHAACPSLIKITKSIAAESVYGMSASLNRGDNLSWILYQCIGPKLASVRRDVLQSYGNLVKPTIKKVGTPYRPTKRFERFEFGKHLTELTECAVRNKFILADIESKLAGRRSLILSDRIDHVEFFGNELRKFGSVIYHGKLKKKDKEAAAEQLKTSNLTCATYQSLSEGFDAPAWDQLFLTTPFSSEIRAIQSIGRICRPSPGKTEALVWDYVDVNDPILLKKAGNRDWAYKQL
jgi:superfamily II DNA or RNA helicase